MNAAMLVLTPLLPMLLAAWLIDSAKRRWLPLAVLPALITALWLPEGSQLTLPWLLLGTHLQLDATAQLLLLFSALIWLVAAITVAAGQGLSPGRDGFLPSFLLAMAGNFIVLLAADVVTFYLGFALMGLSAYGMLVQPRSQRARRAARVYLTYTLIGEVALFAGIVLLVAATGTTLFAELPGRTPPGAAVALLLLGFGIKVALPGLHLWLPLTYTLAPLTAVAVLSGPMMKAGLLGWIRFLPPDTAGAAAWGDTLITLGTLGVALGVLLGIVQRQSRAVLAYSSIAKMGLMGAVFGVALNADDSATSAAIIAALLLLAMHHLLVKSALFLGVGISRRYAGQRWPLLPLGLLALSLAGLPFTAGGAAKLSIGDALGDQLAMLLTLSAIGTALLMVRFMLLVYRETVDEQATTAVTAPNGATLAWLLLVPVALVAPFSIDALRLDIASLALLAGGLVLAALGWAVTRHWKRLQPAWMNRDGVQLLSAALRRLGSPLRGLPNPRWPSLADRLDITSAAAPATSAALVGAGLRWLTVFAVLLLAILLPW